VAGARSGGKCGRPHDKQTMQQSTQHRTAHVGRQALKCQLNKINMANKQLAQANQILLVSQKQTQQKLKSRSSNTL